MEVSVSIMLYGGREPVSIVAHYISGRNSAEEDVRNIDLRMSMLFAKPQRVGLHAYGGPRIEGNPRTEVLAALPPGRGGDGRTAYGHHIGVSYENSKEK